MADFRSSPAYLRVIQRLQKIPTHQRHLLDSLSVDAKFADEETRSRLQSMARESRKTFRGKSLGLREKAFDVDIGLRREAFDFGREQERTATGVGIGQLVAETDFSGQREDLDLALVKKKLAFASRYGV